MKYCNTCGEVYASRALACAVDGSALMEWSESSNFARGDSQVTSIRQDTGVRENDLTNVDTNIEVLAPRNVKRAARGKHAQGSDSQEVSEHTDVIDATPHETLTDFNGSDGTGGEAGNLVVYDNEVTGPFKGMLISNRYRLETKIGSGAFGVVFEAFDKEDEKRVAIKLLSAALCDDKRALTRFRREAIAASRIRHPGIVTIHDFGIQDKGQSYIVMEYLDGSDLATILENEGRVSPGRASTIVEQCAQALAAAHDAGVLHRDLKPANIFVVQEADQSERIRILDFGIAKDRRSNPRLADLTSASKVVGTPYYMAPEQAQGRDIDARADVYSLGVMLYELVTGTHPFEGESVYEILLAHISGPRVAPSEVCPALASEGDLDSIVLKAISADANHRYRSMHEFAAALRCYLRGERQSVHQLPAYSDIAGAHASNTSITASRSGLVTSQFWRANAKHKRAAMWATLALLLAGFLFVALRTSSNSAQAPSPSASTATDTAVPLPSKPPAAPLASEPPAAPLASEPPAAPRFTQENTAAIEPVLEPDIPNEVVKAPVAKEKAAPQKKNIPRSSEQGSRRRDRNRPSSKTKSTKGIEEW